MVPTIYACVRFASPEVWRLFTDLFDCCQLHWSVSKCCCTRRSVPFLDTTPNSATGTASAKSEDGPCRSCVDPAETFGFALSPGAGFTFGGDITAQFNRRNGLKLVTRAQSTCDGWFSGATSRAVSPCFLLQTTLPMWQSAAIMQVM